MSTNAKLYIVLAASFCFAAWGATEILRAAFEPLMKGLGG